MTFHRGVIALAFLCIPASELRAEHLLAPSTVSGDPQITDADRLRASQLARESYDLLERNDVRAAERRLREALVLVPDKAVWHFNMACILAISGRADPAMDSLERAADLGFTDFTTLQSAPALRTLHDLPRFQSLLTKKDVITHNAAARAVEQLRARFGVGYLYVIDDDRKLIFATNTDQATLDSLRSRLHAQAKSQERDLFSHQPDEFIRVVVPSQAEYRRIIRRPGVRGLYDDETRTLVAEQIGQVMTHEFTHALHAADQRALGQEHPIWLREGLAAMYEAAEFDGDRLVPHDNFRLAYVHQAGVRHGLIPLDKLLRLRQQDFFAGPNLSYGQTSSLLLYLYEQNLLKKFYDAYVTTYASDMSGQAALESVTGMKLSELETAWTKWMLARKVPAVTTAPGGPDLGARFGPAVDGLRISFIVPGGAAGKAGLKAGDIIVGFDNHEIRDYASLAPLLASHAVGQEISLRIHRETKYLEVPIVLGQR